MTKTALINGRILTPQGFVSNRVLVIENGTIAEICDDQNIPSDHTIIHDVNGNTLLPGLIDLQVNGGGGVLFNDDPSVGGIRKIVAAHRRFGTTGFLPTLISDDMDIMKMAIKAVDQAIKEGVPGVLGVHLEGPFLNINKRGVHDAAHIKKLEDEFITLLASLQYGKTLVTLAPEQTEPGLTRKLVQVGVIVAAGHTLANYAQTLAALDAGLTGFTHLFNAMRPLDSREPGVIAAALEDSRAWCGIIADGHHVHPAMLRLAYRAKLDKQIFLVTDAMPSVGAKAKNFMLGDQTISVSGGKCVTENNQLAGSDLNMMEAVKNAADMLEIDLEHTVKMASGLPAQFIGLDKTHGEIRIGAQADIIEISANMTVLNSWIGGEKISYA
ncbi:MAG TPA: N-acetylglucosamine-6-phosphate deacetylase [Hellea balneolensis]|uniref:N-acetylglucosamine-6-phosphate deacetylase n=1 Tax=Hellea balneolensis TaxID=287478 RepID=A0A7C5LVW9_9PROT|nr:N-acetylglucosamine-6-phosphate deacetylase [Hellea balneolensis]